MEQHWSSCPWLLGDCIGQFPSMLVKPPKLTGITANPIAKSERHRSLSHTVTPHDDGIRRPVFIPLRHRLWASSRDNQSSYEAEAVQD